MSFDRYGIYRADLNPTRGSEIAKGRSVVIVSLDELNEALETVVVCPLTTKSHPRWRCRIPVQCRGKLAEIAVDQIRTISKTRLRAKTGSLTRSEAAILRALLTEMYGTN